jgi:glycerol-3-phosphate acyltransferase PlsY
MLMPQVTGIVFLIWLVLVKLTGYVSLGSMVAAVCVPVLAFAFHAPMEYIVFGVAAALLIVVRHKANIGRLLNGTESKIKAGHR